MSYPRILLWLAIAIVVVAPASAPCQEVKVEKVPIRTTTRTIEKTTVEFGGHSLSEAPPKLIGEKVSEREAAKITLDEKPEDISVVDDDLQVSTPMYVGETESGMHDYLVDQPSGRYGVVLGKFVPFEIESEGPDVSSILDLSFQLASKIDDRTHALSIAKAINTTLDTYQGSNLSEIQQQVNKAIKKASLYRKGESLRKDWTAGWRSPLYDALLESNAMGDFESYVSAMKAAAAGLLKEPPEGTTGPDFIHPPVGAGLEHPKESPPLAQPKMESVLEPNPVPMQTLFLTNPVPSYQWVPNQVQNCGANCRLPRGSWVRVR